MRQKPYSIRGQANASGGAGEKPLANPLLQLATRSETADWVAPRHVPAAVKLRTHLAAAQKLTVEWIGFWKHHHFLTPTERVVGPIGAVDLRRAPCCGSIGRCMNMALEVRDYRMVRGQKHRGGYMRRLGAFPRSAGGIAPRGVRPRRRFHCLSTNNPQGTEDSPSRDHQAVSNASRTRAAKSA